MPLLLLEFCVSEVLVYKMAPTEGVDLLSESS